MRSKAILGCTLTLGTVMLATTALAAPSLIPSETLGQVKLTAVVNVRELAARAAAQGGAARAAGMLEMPIHRYPQFAHHTAPLKFTGSNVELDRASAATSLAPAGFNGIYGAISETANGFDVEPPDQGLAVANNEVVEIVNLAFEVFDNKGNSLATPVSLNALLNAQSGDSDGDPHVEYDASTQRWFVDSYVQNGTFNGYNIAVSTTSDPLGTYYVYRVDEKTSTVSGCGGSCFGDYPQPGYDANGFYIAVDLFSNVSGNFVQAGIYAMPKAALIAGKTFTYQRILVNDFVVEPSIPAAPGGYATAQNGTEYLMTATQIFDGTNDVRVYAISNTAKIGTGKGLVVSSVTVPVQAYASTVASTEPNIVGPYGQSVGATSAPLLDGGYNAFGSGVKYLNGALYATLTSGATDGNGLARDVLAYFAVTPSVTSSGVTAAVTGQGYIVPPNGYSLSYAGLAINNAGDGILGFTVTNPDDKVAGGFPSAAYLRFVGGRPTKTYAISGRGTASDDGFTGYPPYGGPVGRWGDYSSATVDPVTGMFYVGNEYIPNVKVYPRSFYTNWGTFITEVK